MMDLYYWISVIATSLARRPSFFNKSFFYHTKRPNNVSWCILKVRNTSAVYVSTLPTTCLFVESGKNRCVTYEAGDFFSCCFSVAKLTTKYPPFVLLYLSRSSINRLSTRLAAGVCFSCIFLGHSSILPQQRPCYDCMYEISWN